jgi:mRNA-degrading endonuclease RelE of RelBE toxin-antitoxin system
MGYEIKLIETSIFVQQIQRLLNDKEYAAFRKYLKENPDIAPIIPGTGGARKMRWAKKGKGKSGGIRILYLYRSRQGDIFLLLAFAKSDQENLNTDQKKMIKTLINQLKRTRGE